MPDKYDAFLDAPEAKAAPDKYDAFLDAPSTSEKIGTQIKASVSDPAWPTDEQFHQAAQSAIRPPVPDPKTMIAGVTNSDLPGTWANSAQNVIGGIGRSLQDVGEIAKPVTDALRNSFQNMSLDLNQGATAVEKAKIAGIPNAMRASATLADVVSGTSSGSQGVMGVAGSLAGGEAPKWVKRGFDHPWVSALADGVGSLLSSDNFIYLPAEEFVASSALLKVLERMGFAGSILEEMPKDLELMRKAHDDGDWRTAQYLATKSTMRAFFAGTMMMDASVQRWNDFDKGRKLTPEKIDEFGSSLKTALSNALDIPGKVGKPAETVPKVKHATDAQIEDFLSLGPDKLKLEPEPMDVPPVGLHDELPGPPNAKTFTPKKMSLDEELPGQDQKPESPPRGTPIQIADKTVPAAGTSPEVVAGTEGEPVQRNEPAAPDLRQKVNEGLPEDPQQVLDRLRQHFGLDPKVVINLDPGADISSTTPKGKHEYDVNIAADRADAASVLHEFYHVLDGEGKLPKDFPKDEQGKPVFDNNAITGHFLESQAEPQPVSAQDFFERHGTPILSKMFNVTKATTGPGVGLMNKLLGERNQWSEAYFNKAERAFHDHFESIPQDVMLENIDKFEHGHADQIEDPTTRQAMQMFDGLYKQAYAEYRKWDPDLKNVPNYIFRLWKTPPLRNVELLRQYGIGEQGQPLEGFKGWTQERSFRYLRDGIEHGGEPLTTNPADLFGMYMDDMMKLFSAKRAVAAAVKQGTAKLVPYGIDGPDGWRPVDDKVLRNPQGHYVFHPELAQMLENYLSYDRFKDPNGNLWGIIPNKALGNWMQYKRLATEFELGFSGFHAGFIANEATASDLGMAMSRGSVGAVNLIMRDALGLRGANPTPVREALAEVGRAALDAAKAAPGMFSPLTSTSAYKFGHAGSLLREASEASRGGLVPDDLTRWLQTDRGKQLATMTERLGFSSPQDVIQAVYDHGGRFGQVDSLRSNSFETFKDSVQRGDTVGQVLRAAPGLVNMVSKPLFQQLIPNIKAGYAMYDFANRLNMYQPELKMGIKTKDSLWLESLRRSDNVFGEMGFDNLFWNNTFKSALQGLLRSATWKIGSLRQFSDAAVSQWNVTFGKYEADMSNALRFRLSPDMAWALGSLITHVAQSTVITWALTGKPPQESIDYLFPPTGGTDSTGHKTRIVPPGYTRDLMHFTAHPGDYMASSLSAPVGKVIGAWVNGQNYWGDYVGMKDPASIAEQALPVPFSLQSTLRMKQDQASDLAAAMTMAGYAKASASSEVRPGAFISPNAPGMGTHTDTERAIERARKGAGLGEPIEAGAAGSKNVIRQAQQDFRYGSPDTAATAKQRIEAQKDVSPASIKAAEKNMKKSPYEVAIAHVDWDKMPDLLDSLPEDGVAKYGKALLDRWHRAKMSHFNGIPANKLPELQQKFDNLQRRRDAIVGTE